MNFRSNRYHIRIAVTAILVMLCTILSSIPISGYATQTTIGDVKITEVLNKILIEAKDDDIIPIYVWITPVDLERAEQILLNQYGYKADDYTDEQRFNEIIVPKLQDTIDRSKNSNPDYFEKNINNLKYIRELFNIDEVMTDDEISRCLNEEMTILDIAKIGEQQEFLKYKRQCVRTLQKEINQAFVERVMNVKYESLNIYDNSSLVTMKVSKESVYLISKIDMVMEIGYFENPQAEKLISTGAGSNQQIMGITSAQSIYPSVYGSGIKIGIVESVDASFADDPTGLNPEYIHVEDSIGTRILKITNYSIDESPFENFNGNYTWHSAYVTSILTGDSKTVGGVTYRGVAPQAATYFTTCTTFSTLQTAFDILINTCNANIINLSFTMGDGYYSYITQYIDEQIKNNNISVFIASGNNTYILSGLSYSYNAIVVGNVDTSGGYSSTGYAMYSSSSYYESTFTYLTNKPDISASGTSIGFAAHDTLDGNMGWGHVTGTSFSCPFVAGVAALMMQKQSTLISNPTLVKAILSAAADPEKINNKINLYDDNNDPLMLFDNCGAGLMNAYDAVYASQESDFVTNTVSWTSTPPSSQYSSVSTLYLEAGDKIRVAMSYLKNDNVLLYTLYGTDVDIILKQVSSGSTVAYSISSKNNVEIIEYTVSTSGYYTIQRAIVSVHTATNSYCKMAFSWVIEY